MDSDFQEIILINEAYFRALIADIAAAKEMINLEAYIYANDEVGRQVTTALCEAARRGVVVRVLVDGIGTSDWGSELTIQLEEAGVVTRVFHPLPWRWDYRSARFSSLLEKIIYSISRINRRNHRKTCVIDHRIAYVGSANVTACHHLLAEKSLTLRDTTAKLLNVATDELEEAFDSAWARLSLKKRWRRLRKKIPVDPQFRLNYSWRRRLRLYRSFLKRIKGCRNRIWITNPYFVPNSRLLVRLIRAAKRGVDVKILLPTTYDVMAMSFLTRSFYEILLLAGVSLYEYTPRILHAKSLILDDWYSVGSSNLNYRSHKHDLEVDVHIQTDAAKKALEHQFLEDLLQAHKVQPADLIKVSWMSKLIGRLLLMLRYWF